MVAPHNPLGFKTIGAIMLELNDFSNWNRFNAAVIRNKSISEMIKELKWSFFEVDWANPHSFAHGYAISQWVITHA